MILFLSFRLTKNVKEKTKFTTTAEMRLILRHFNHVISLWNGKRRNSFSPYRCVHSASVFIDFHFLIHPTNCHTKCPPNADDLSIRLLMYTHKNQQQMRKNFRLLFFYSSSLAAFFLKGHCSTRKEFIKILFLLHLVRELNFMAFASVQLFVLSFVRLSSRSPTWIHTTIIAAVATLMIYNYAPVYIKSFIYTTIKWLVWILACKFCSLINCPLRSSW